MIKRLFSLIVVAMFVLGFSGMAVGSGEKIRTYSMSIYDTGSGTTVDGPADAGTNGVSQYFTWRADGARAATADNRTFDLNDNNPNWRSASFRLDFSAVTDVATSGATYYVEIESCYELSDTNCGWDADYSSGISVAQMNPSILNVETVNTTYFTGVSHYPIDITSLMSPNARYYRFRFRSGSSQFPGSPTGTSWANEVGPKAYMVITSY